MNAKRILAVLLAVLMVSACFVSMVSAEEAADKFAPTNEEQINLTDGGQSAAYGGFGKGQSVGVKVTVPAGKRLTQINFHALATYNTNVNHIVFKVYQWNTDYKTSVAGPVLAQTTVMNHTDNAPLDVILPTNRNLTGELLWVATYVDGASQMTPWGSDGAATEGAVFFSNGSVGGPFCCGITIGDALTVEPASYTATFMADGVEIAKETFLEGDKELLNVPAIPEKEGFWADWEAYTLNNEDIVINAVYTDASGAIKPEIEDPTKMTAFSEDHASFLRAEGCTSKVNRDGSVSFTGVWGLDADIDAYATINYLQLMKKYYTGYDGQKTLPNKSHKYNVVAIKVVAPPVALESTPNMTVIVGRNTEIYGVEVANEIRCDNTEEYWIFDFSGEPDFTSDAVNSMKINWAYAYGEEDNLGAEFKILGFQFFDNMEEALAVTSQDPDTQPDENVTEDVNGDENTPADTDAADDETKAENADTAAGDETKAENADTNPANDETKAEGTTPDGETQAAEGTTAEGETEAAKSGCGAVVGFGAVAVLAAAAAAVALKKKD